MTANDFRSYLSAMLTALGASAAMLAATCASAQSAVQNWYRVEVVIFERLGGQPATSDPEVWPKDLFLAYEPNWQTLLEEPLKDDPLTDEEEMDTAEGMANAPSVDDDSIPPEDQAFVLLPHTEHTLGGVESVLSRQRNIRVLFHEAWLQPMEERDKAPAIVIQGGNEYGSHHELEGTITPSLSRYLHLHTNLWLTHFMPNYGQDTEHWPPLPTPPRKVDEDAPSTLPPETATDDPAAQWTSRSAWDVQPVMDDDYQSLIDQPFLIDQIVTMKQNRRMRGGELHYLDHPRMGIIVTMEAYELKDDVDGQGNTSTAR